MPKIIPLSRIESPTLPNSITFSWNCKLQKMVLSAPNEDKIGLNLLKNASKMIIQFEKKSGVKKDSCILFSFLFFLSTVLGFTASYFLIISKQNNLGGMTIIFTALFVYFGFMFLLYFRGTQLKRVNKFIEKNGENFIKEASKFGYDVVIGFQRGNYFIFFPSRKLKN